jgi:hypothetical protein
MANVSQPTYETIVNFCTDNKLLNVPLPEMMGYLLQIKDGSYGRIPTSLGKSFLMNDLEIIELEASSGDGKILYVQGVCPPLIKMCKDMETLDGYEELNIMIDDETAGFVLAYDVTPGLPLADLTRQFKEYLSDTVVFDSFSTHYVNEDVVLDFIDGIDPLYAH